MTDLTIMNVILQDPILVFPLNTKPDTLFKAQQDSPSTFKLHTAAQIQLIL